jgi:hypothetical protein
VGGFLLLAGSVLLGVLVRREDVARIDETAQPAAEQEPEAEPEAVYAA